VTKISRKKTTEKHFAHDDKLIGYICKTQMLININIIKLLGNLIMLIMLVCDITYTNFRLELCFKTSNRRAVCV